MTGNYGPLPVSKVGSGRVFTDTVFALLPTPLVSILLPILVGSRGEADFCLAASTHIVFWPASALAASTFAFSDFSLARFSRTPTYLASERATRSARYAAPATAFLSRAAYSTTGAALTIGWILPVNCCAWLICSLVASPAFAFSFLPDVRRGKTMRFFEYASRRACHAPRSSSRTDDSIEGGRRSQS